MTAATHSTIMETAKQIFARSGYDGLSMRSLAEESGVGLSSIYHFFADKDILLKQIFDLTNTMLGKERAALPKRKSAEALLKDRIKFQFAHIEDVVFVLKYFLHYHEQFERQQRGFIPSKGYLHIEEVLLLGIQTGELRFGLEEIASEAKIITHAINGFLLEYYPNPPTGRELSEVMLGLHSFIWRAVTAARPREKSRDTERRKMVSTITK